MDLDNMMITPVMYQDIPSSFMMQPMPMMGMYGTMTPYPTYGVSPMRPTLADDKFERLQAKDKETKHTMRNTGIALAVLTTIGLLFGKKFNIKTPGLFKKIGGIFQKGYKMTKNGLSIGYNATKTGGLKAYNWVKNTGKAG